MCILLGTESWHYWVAFRTYSNNSKGAFCEKTAANYFCKELHLILNYVLNTPLSIQNIHCVKGVRIRSFSSPHFPAFGLNTERYFVSLRIQSECRKIRTRRTPNTDTFKVVIIIGITETSENALNLYQG